jgi:hypothetical protein
MPGRRCGCPMRCRFPHSLGNSPRVNCRRRTRVEVYLSGFKKPPYYRRGLLTIRVFRLSTPITESRRADSNRLTLLITSDRSGVAGVCRGLQMPHI